METRWQRFVFLTVLASVLYYPVVDYFFIQDDWVVIDKMVNGQWGDLFSPGTFWRPLPTAYFCSMYRVFGLWPFAFHVVAILMLGGIGVLIYDIARRSMGAFNSSCVAVIYICSTNIMFEPMAWMVGAYDLFAIVFVLAGFLAILNRKWWLLCVCAVCAALSRFYISMDTLSFAKDHPYKVGISAMSITSNLSYYINRLSDAISPVDGLGVWLLLPLLLTRSSRNWKLTGLTLLAVIPLLLVQNHRYAYYTAYALIPFSMLVVNFLNRKVLVGSLAVLCLVSGFAWTYKHDSIGARKFNALFVYNHSGYFVKHHYNTSGYNMLPMKSREYKFLYDVYTVRGVPKNEIPNRLIEFNADVKLEAR